MRWLPNGRWKLLVLAGLFAFGLRGQDLPQAKAGKIYDDTEIPAVWKSESRRDSAYTECADLAMLRWMYGHVKYPTESVLAEVSAELTVTFYPATVAGEAVRSYRRIPVSFSMD
jgi:hypothetical protein